MKYIVCAGGTAGHINPALSLCQELKKADENNEILFIGTSDRIESDLVPRAGFPYKGIKITGLSRSFTPSGIIHNIKTAFRLVSASAECRKIIKDFAPDAVIGFGGYVSGPVVRAAHKLGIKTAIHEQNAFPGKANIALAKYVDAVMITSPDTADRLHAKNTPVTTGLPVRSEIASADKLTARRKLGIPEDKKVILITGGSLGAHAINDVMRQVLPDFINDDRLLFIHGYGSLEKDYPEKLKKDGIDIRDGKNAVISEYIYNMADCMAAADLMICRAGASTIAEIGIMGKASVLIPYPYATENHQYYNALSLSAGNAAVLIEQKDLSADKIREIINKLMSSPGYFIEMGENAKKTAIPDAAGKICGIVLSLNDRKDKNV